MDAVPPPRRPWPLIVASVVLASALGYVVLGGWVPSRQRLTDLETEIQDVYRNEATLQTRLVRSMERIALLERRVTAVTAERDRLAHRIRLLEDELRTLKTPKKRRR
jgi:septal ring factor EnvC (AmiA/AmiB activator)